ncbi:MAG: bifunctional phosphoribosylaminoimidazolecarboxamide formyltransferase/IMP cyclohydrolase [Defluviitaleaceae bacterium]|nr:bifunctional phosphoribosylaminoimidazolecarboxamide formyltransferase/IMP cyclohydrolase [Defluviitaleaceae bacterium]
MKKRALISVSNKTGIVNFAKELVNLNYEIISTGGTYKTLKENGIKAIEVSEITNFPEILDGRVKTLHPAIHGGLLANLDLENHKKQIEALNISPISIVVVNLYPFKETISRKEVTLELAIENIDIGGPSMLRSAAKNNKHVTVIVDPTDYEPILKEIKNGEISKETKFKLAAKVFSHTSAYDSIIANYLNEQAKIEPELITLTFEKHQNLRYGENPHQSGAFYKDPFAKKGIAMAKQLQGKELSYNNINDANAALELVYQFEQPTAAAIKHMNPCGISSAETINEAYKLTYEADPISIFGGIIALNRIVDKDLAEELNKTFLEIIIAPSYTKESLEVLSKKQNVRVLEINMENEHNEASSQIENLQNIKPITENKMLTSVLGGLLIQDIDNININNLQLEIPTKLKPSEEDIKGALFAQKVVKAVKSNAIVVAKDSVAIGIGAGQTNRVGAAKIALEKASEKAKGAILASDAFFPMADTIELAAKYGIKTIIQPGGSIKDKEIIEACDKLEIAMIITRARHFKH